MSTDAVAVIGFVVLFVLMLARVPVGMAMGLVGVGGFSYLVNGDAAAVILISVRAYRLLFHPERLAKPPQVQVIE